MWPSTPETLSNTFACKMKAAENAAVPFESKGKMQCAYFNFFFNSSLKQGEAGSTMEI